MRWSQTSHATRNINTVELLWHHLKLADCARIPQTTSPALINERRYSLAIAGDVPKERLNRETAIFQVHCAKIRDTVLEVRTGPERCRMLLDVQDSTHDEIDRGDHVCGHSLPTLSRHGFGGGLPRRHHG